MHRAKPYVNRAVKMKIYSDCDLGPNCVSGRPHNFVGMAYFRLDPTAY